MTDSLQKIPFMVPWMDTRESDAVARVIATGWITQGPEVAAFEREFAQAVGAPHACAVSNCTTALHLALLAVGVRPGDEVITVSHSFIATANAVRYCGAEPVFIDIQPETCNMDPALIEAAVTPRTRAILCVHQMGMPCDLGAIVDAGRRHGLPVVEDAACAIGGEILWDGEWQRIGRPHGDVACFSFHPRKLLTTGDGGMLTTRNEAYDKQFRLWRQHAMSVPDTVRHNSSQVIFETYPHLGYNYRMTDIQAAVGRVQLARLPEIIARRREQGARYAALLAGVDGVEPLREPQWARTNWQSYCVRLGQGRDQRAVMQGMLDRGIATRRGIMNAHLEGAYADRPRRFALPHSEAAQNGCIVLPLYHSMGEELQVRVVGALREALNGH